MQRSALCRSRRALSNEYLLAKIGVDTAENEPVEVWGKNSVQYSLHSLPTTNFERSELTRRDRLRCHLLLPVPRTRLKENSETTKNVCCFSPKTCQNKMQKCGTRAHVSPDLERRGPRSGRGGAAGGRGAPAPLAPRVGSLPGLFLLQA